MLSFPEFGLSTYTDNQSLLAAIGLTPVHGYTDVPYALRSLRTQGFSR